MDSGNSSSMQSSSGGDEEYDSRADHQSLSAFLDPPPQHPPPPPPPPRPPYSIHQLHFDNSLLSNYFSNNPLSLAGSDPTTAQPDLRTFAAAAATTSSSIPRPRPPPPPPQRSFGGGGATNNHNHMGPVVMKNPKKRSRASRRAPTTVLTTDTSNFRAMVQEFTGIPTPLFSNNINTRLNINSFFGLSSPSNNCLLRPFPQKIVPTTTSPLISSLSCPNSIGQQLPHPNSSCSTSTDINIYQNLNLQSLLHVPVTSTSDDHNNNVKTSGVHSLVEELGLGVLQNTCPSSSNTPAPMLCRRESTGNGENGGYDHGGEGNNNPLTLMRADNNGGGGDDSSVFHGDKQIENVTTSTRNEGTIESWLCSSSSDQRT